MRFRVLVLAAVFATAASSFAYTTLSTKWSNGPNSATFLSGNQGTSGSFTWSIMGAGLGVTGFENHGGGLSGNFGALVGTLGTTEEVAIINSVMNTWANASGLTHLGQVADGNVAGGATQATGGHLGDIRFGVFGSNTFPANVLAHAYQPGTEALAVGGTILGDVHVNAGWNWVDSTTPGLNQIDLYTVLLHEVGHALGLGHSNVVGSVMEPVYAGPRRSLHADDLAGITFIYGPGPMVPEPATMAAMGLGLAWIARRRKSKATRL